MGTVTQGTRRPDDTAPWDLNPGDYCFRGGQVWVKLPNGAGPSNLTDWNPVEHEDGTITLSPSISDLDSGWHGYLERGIWREV